MELIRNVSLIIFGLVAVALMISNYLPLFRDMMKDKGRKTTKHNITVGQGLEILKSSTDSLSKAKAFVSLMDLSYVLVHTLVNKGNNYDDEIQNKRFHKFLTPQVMKEIVGVEGKYE